MRRRLAKPPSMKSFFRPRPIYLLKTMVLLGGLTASLVQALPPTLPAINQAPTGQQLTGKLTWFDLLTDNVATAKQFYGPVFGWTFADAPGSKGKFSVISVGNERIGGIFQRSKPATSGPTTRWLTFISVPDAAAAAQYTKNHGGQVISGPTSVPARGTHVVMLDPQGAMFAVLKSDSGDPIDDPAQPGEILWADLFVAKPDAAAEFYHGLVGWNAEEKDSRGAAEHLVVNAGGFSRAGITMLPPGAQQPGWLPYVQVANIQATLKRVKSAGGKIMTPPSREILDGRLAVIADPQGGVIGIVNWTGPTKKAGR
jgi:predicted enzyme related to lactoylglutathione lyase